MSSDSKSQDHNSSRLASRRKVLGMAWLGSFLAMTGATFAGMLKFLTPRSDGGFGGIVRAGKVDEFPPGSMSLIKEGRFYLHRLDDGAFLAQWQRCTHLGCSVPWDEDAREFRCPCHGSAFSPTGEVLGGPAPRPLDVFQVSVQDGELLVDTGSPVERSTFDPSQTTAV